MIRLLLTVLLSYNILPFWSSNRDMSNVIHQDSLLNSRYIVPYKLVHLASYRGRDSTTSLGFLCDISAVNTTNLYEYFNLTEVDELPVHHDLKVIYEHYRKCGGDTSHVGFKDVRWQMPQGFDTWESVLLDVMTRVDRGIYRWFTGKGDRADLFFTIDGKGTLWFIAVTEQEVDDMLATATSDVVRGVLERNISLNKYEKFIITWVPKHDKAREGCGMKFQLGSLHDRIWDRYC